MTCGDSKDSSSCQTPKKRSASQNLDSFESNSPAKMSKIEVTLASSEAGQLGQIESEFQILKSLIPNIANKQQINEVRTSLRIQRFSVFERMNLRSMTLEYRKEHRILIKKENTRKIQF